MLVIVTTNSNLLILFEIVEKIDKNVTCVKIVLYMSTYNNKSLDFCFKFSGNCQITVTDHDNSSFFTTLVWAKSFIPLESDSYPHSSFSHFYDQMSNYVIFAQLMNEWQ